MNLKGAVVVCPLELFQPRTIRGGSVRLSVRFLPWGFPFGSRPCGIVSRLVCLGADARETAVQTFTSFGSKPCGLWSLTRPERSFLPSCRPLPMLGGFHVSRFARAATTCRCRVFGFGVAPCVTSCHFVPSRPHSAILGIFVCRVSFRFKAERCKRYAKHRPTGASSRQNILFKICVD